MVQSLTLPYSILPYSTFHYNTLPYLTLHILFIGGAPSSLAV